MNFKGSCILNNFTTGFDIEFVVTNTRGRYVSAIPFIPGTKAQPHWDDCGNQQRDNVALEIAVNYGYNVADLLFNTQAVLNTAIGMLPKGYRIHAMPSVLFDPKELKHPEAKEFGCDADYDAKTGNANDMEGNLGIVDPNLRSFGFHVHTGLPPEYTQLHVLMSDFVLGLFSTIKDSSMEAMRRRELYGKPSCYRTKEYGVEYRTLSNYWAGSPRLLETVYLLNQIARHMTLHQPATLMEHVDINHVSDIILAGDEAAAAEIFFEHIYQHLDFRTKRYLIDELEYNNYGDMVTEWELDVSTQAN